MLCVCRRHHCEFALSVVTERLGLVLWYVVLSGCLKQRRREAKGGAAAVILGTRTEAERKGNKRERPMLAICLLLLSPPFPPTGRRSVGARGHWHWQLPL